MSFEDKDTMLSGIDAGLLSDEELTDDEVYLERHEKAFSDYLNQSLTLTKKRQGSERVEEQIEGIKKEDSFTFIKIHLNGESGILEGNSELKL